MKFEDFFQAVYGQDHAGPTIEPFPWQSRLAKSVGEQGWPAVLDLPTSSGKTNALDIAVHHLLTQLAEIQAGEREQRTAPLRIFFVVDRRIVVDGAYRHARHLAEQLRTATSGPLADAKRLFQSHFEVDEPLHVSLMRGGMYRDNGWTASPVQPTICVSTVDQVGSRLLFRGYGVSPSMRPVHAGLVANDSLLLIDEAHLSEPFLQTLDSVRLYAGKRFAEQSVSRPFQVVRMSATTPDDENRMHRPFRIDQDDRRHPVFQQRLSASKVTRLEKVTVDKEDPCLADEQFATAAVSHAVRLARLTMKADTRTTKDCKRSEDTNGFAPAKVIGIVVNRVRTARAIFDKLRKRPDVRDPLRPMTNEPERDMDRSSLAGVILLTGRMRPFERDELLFREPIYGQRGWLEWIKSGRKAEPPAPVFVVATQTVEVGADLDFDALITEAAPLDCLRQRFGRLDRRGDRKRSQAILLGRSTDIAKTAKDRVYGNRLTATWHWLIQNTAGKGKDKAIDFGVDAIEKTMQGADLAKLCAPRQNAPVLLPPYIDLWSRTNPAPAADPDVGLFLHGPDTRPADVQVVWRADLLSHGELELESHHQADYISTVALLPPTSMEACSVSVDVVKRWLGVGKRGASASNADIGDIADLEGDSILEEPRVRFGDRGRIVLRWRGADTSSLSYAVSIQPGDTIIVPASYGGHDAFGWQPASGAVKDVAESCVRWGRGRSVVRCHRSLLTRDQWGARLEGAFPEDEDSVRDFLESLAALDGVPAAVRSSCQSLLKSGGTRTIAYELSGATDEAWVVVDRRRLTITQVLQETQGEWDTDVDDETIPDDDDASSFTGVPVSLDEHTCGVVNHIKQFCRLAGLSLGLSRDLNLTARWHDVGKLDERFQTLLHNGDPVDALMALLEGRPLAKSGQTYRSRAASSRAWQLAGLPKRFRHEALSVILLRTTDLRSELDDASDRELVEYLIGSHHGNGRPSHPVSHTERNGQSIADNSPLLEVDWRSRHIRIDTGAQQSQALYRLDNDWEGLFARMNRRYGYWGLAWLEALFRLADHCQSSLDSK